MCGSSVNPRLLDSAVYSVCATISKSTPTPPRGQSLTLRTTCSAKVSNSSRSSSALSSSESNKVTKNVNSTNNTTGGVIRGCNSKINVQQGGVL
eukprot:1574062-Pyramimonas_sp.AAC.1